MAFFQKARPVWASGPRPKMHDIVGFHRSFEVSERSTGDLRIACSSVYRAWIDGELVARSTGTQSPFTLGARIFHDKFGYGQVTGIEGNKLTVAFDKAGEKKVLDSFVMAA